MISNDLDMFFKPIVLITGFGPFENHPVNASWEGVKLMNKDEIENKHNCELVLLEIPVTYENVDEFIPALWETHTPKLMMHVGVSNIARNLTLETQAHRKGYKRMDYLNNCPANHMCTADGAIRLKTKLDVERIHKEFNVGNPFPDTNTEVSFDAGRYLCEYTYYTSLSVDNTRTLFVHVPEMQVYSSEQTAKGLERILDLCLQQINENEQPNQLANTLKNSDLGSQDE